MNQDQHSSPEQEESLDSKLSRIKAEPLSAPVGGNRAEEVEKEVEALQSIARRREEEALELAQARERLKALRLKNDRLQDANEARKTYADKVFQLISLWLVVVVVLISANGLGEMDLSDAVILALIGGTTVNVLGLFAIVMRYLFPRGGHHDRREEN